MQDEEKFKDNSEEAKEKRYQDAMKRIHTKRLITICFLLAAIFAGINIMMSQGAFDFIFLKEEREAEEKRQEVMQILEESLSESLASDSLQSEKQTEEESVYKKISNKLNQGIPYFYITKDAQNSDGWIMAEGFLSNADFTNGMEAGIVFENQVQEVSKVYVNFEEGMDDELKKGSQIETQINIQADNLEIVKQGSVVALMENIHETKDIVMYAYFFESCTDTLETGTTVCMDIAGNFIQVNLGTIKNSFQFDVSEVTKGQLHYIFITLDDEIYIIDNFTVPIYNTAGDYIGNAILYEER